MTEFITARGVRVHNLKNLSFELPLGKFIVITGVSGSGKSSLAFDTLYAEGQRRYVESFSAYARQFLERMDRPDADHIEGIPPAIAIEQKNPIRTSRSTVGTSTEISDYLRLLFARIGKTFCRGCGRPVSGQSVEHAVDEVLKLPAGTRVLVCFRYLLSKKAKGSEVATALIANGYVRIVLNGEVVDLDPQKPPKLAKAQELLVVVDRLVVSETVRQRLADSLDMAYREGGGRATVLIVGESSGETSLKRCPRPTPLPETLLFTSHLVCPYCNIEYPEPSPQLFSFNSPLGACARCHGFGDVIEVDMDKVVPDKRKTIRQGALACYNTPVYKGVVREIIAESDRYGIPVDVPFEKLTPEQLRLIREGSKDFYGVDEFFDWMETKKYKMQMRVFLSRYRSYVRCPECRGTRLKPEGNTVKVAGRTISELGTMTVSDARAFFEALRLEGEDEQIAGLLVREILKRLTYLDAVGAGYLTIDRPSRTLSGGEAQRVGLTTSLGSALVNTLYILDEPSIGLHPRDSRRLIRVLEDLRNLGNTVVVVEHDREIMESADLLMDLGPGAGERGGEITFLGPVQEIRDCPQSLTGQYLSGKKRIDVPSKRRRLPPKDRWIRLFGASENNLGSIDVSIPLGLFTCVSGVSGSGKSTLVDDTIYGALMRARGEPVEKVGRFARLSGSDLISDVVLVDQSPIGRTPRSNPVTYVKAFDPIRKLFAAGREARLRGYAAAHFSFNSAAGQCPICKGQGQVKVEMHFLADLFLKCEECGGARYKPGVLEVRCRGKTIGDVLEMTVTEAMEFFSGTPQAVSGLKVLAEVGLGYMRLGQPATTLSGGEAQRLKLAAHMTLGEQRGSTAKSTKKEGVGGKLFIFDEPTTGLHFGDIKTLLGCFEALLARGHTVLVVEHNLDVLKSADYLIDLGPEGGEAGGRVVATGTPEEVARVEGSHTGRFLSDTLGMRK